MSIIFGRGGAAAAAAAGAGDDPAALLPGNGTLPPPFVAAGKGDPAGPMGRGFLADLAWIDALDGDEEEELPAALLDDEDDEPSLRLCLISTFLSTSRSAGCLSVTMRDRFEGVPTLGVVVDTAATGVAATATPDLDDLSPLGVFSFLRASLPSILAFLGAGLPASWPS